MTAIVMARETGGGCFRQVVMVTGPLRRDPPPLGFLSSSSGDLERPSLAPLLARSQALLLVCSGGEACQPASPNDFFSLVGGGGGGDLGHIFSLCVVRAGSYDPSFLII